MIVESAMMLAGEIRPDHVVSLSGYEKDAAIVIEVRSLSGFTHVLVTLETGASKTFPIDFPVPVYSE